MAPLAYIHRTIELVVNLTKNPVLINAVLSQKVTLKIIYFDVFCYLIVNKLLNFNNLIYILFNIKTLNS